MDATNRDDNNVTCCQQRNLETLARFLRRAIRWSFHIIERSMGKRFIEGIADKMVLHCYTRSRRSLPAVTILLRLFCVPERWNPRKPSMCRAKASLSPVGLWGHAILANVRLVGGRKHAIYEVPGNLNANTNCREVGFDDLFSKRCPNYKT
jgi:hypothetical protein